MAGNDSSVEEILAKAISRSTCYLGLGGNLGSPIKKFQDACTELAASDAVQLLEISPLYGSAAMTLAGAEPQPDYINAVLKCQIDCSPLQLLRLVKEVEAKLGRESAKDKQARWEPRSIDIDILLVESVTINSEQLSIPHPGLTQRPFVFYPLLDLAPDLLMPDGKLLKDLTAQVKDEWNTHKLSDKITIMNYV